MRHIIVIETVDPEAGGELLSPQLESVLLRTVEIGVTEAHGVCYVDGRFNVKSAVAAVREMYGFLHTKPQPKTVQIMDRRREDNGEV